jgi:superfamily I DNA and/or RNA helicase
LFLSGGEWDYVILSTVRSLPSYMIEPNPTHGWCVQNLGFITDRNQVNVALTRARKGLIIVGKRGHSTYMSRRLAQISMKEFPHMAECSFSSTLL